MNEVYVLLLNNEETNWKDEIKSIHKTFQSALKRKQIIEIIEKNWQDNELEFSDKEVRVVKTELYD